MLEELLIYLRNWFRVRDDMDGKHPGTYTVQGGGIELDFLQPGQYFRIMGSLLNDGLYIYGDTILDENRTVADLSDETFEGSVWALSIPKAVIKAAHEKAELEAKISEVTNSFAESQFTSESFVDYSYHKDFSGQFDALNARMDELKRRLSRWRKMRED